MNPLRYAFAVLATVLALNVTSPDFAAASTNQGCGYGFKAMTIDKVTEIASDGFDPDRFEAADVNGDGILCVKIFERFPEKNPAFNFDPTFLFLDNHGQGAQ